MPPLDRRRFLRNATLAVAALALPAPSRLLAASGAAAPAIDRSAFPQSVASGDPRSDRVLLWTRCPGASRVLLQVSPDASFASLVVERELAVDADRDHCVRARVTGLAPGRAWYYRFVLERGDARVSSPHGLTRTAPAADADVPVRIAFLSCQDYGGRYYNTLLPLLDDPPDLLLHLGDFIYETAGDPGFQSRDGDRSITFEDEAGALPLGTPEARFFAARSLSNYRQLHRTVRTDPVLQQLLERAPLAAIWDDHEFSDDCWGDAGTYHDGREDEHDTARRHHAEQAYLEYMPVDLVDDEAGPGREDLFPRLRLWRQLDWGRQLSLLLTDYRSHRPDHLVPEDAFPGALAVDEPTLRAVAGPLGLDAEAVLGRLMPYLDLGLERHAGLRPAVTQAIASAYRAEGRDEADALRRAQLLARGPLALAALGPLLDGFNAAAPATLRVTLPTEIDGRGLPWLAIGKTRLFGAVGARYFVVKDAYDLLAAVRAAQGQPSALGAAQTAWLADALARSPARWTLVASSVSFTPIVLDLARPEIQAPPALARRFLLNVDHWDGFPVERDALVQRVFEPAGGAVLLSGDIHAGFATQHAPRTVEFTTPAVSSTTIRSILAGSLGEGEADDTGGAGARMVEHLDALVMAGFEGLRYAQTGRHGVGVLEARADAMDVRFLELPEALCREDLRATPERAAAARTTAAFTLDAATRTLRRAE